MKQLLQRAQPRKNTRSRKAGREKEKPQPSAQDSSRVSVDFSCAGGCVVGEVVDGTWYFISGRYTPPPKTSEYRGIWSANMAVEDCGVAPDLYFPVASHDHHSSVTFPKLSPVVVLRGGHGSGLLPLSW